MRPQNGARRKPSGSATTPWPRRLAGRTCAEDAEARCAAAEKAAEKSASAAAEAISKARYAAKDIEHSRNELAAVASVAAARDELERALAEKTAELEEAGRLAAEVEAEVEANRRPRRR